MRRRSLLISSSGGGTDPSQAAPLEVAFYNGSNIVIRKQEEWLDGETPIGIVVVPGYHDRYGDGSCGIMSLVGMDYSHPESGEPITDSTQTDNVAMCWGHSVLDNDIFRSTTALKGSVNYIPYQRSSASTACSGYTNALIWPYEGTITKPTSGASIEYSNDGGYVTATSGKAACDFNGIRNTAACYVKTHTAAQWTASTVENASGTTNAPPAACAGRFKTVGTKSFLDVFSGITSNDLSYGTPTSTKDNKGFWYLPALGELCYLPSKRFEVNKTILALNQKYGNVGVQLVTTNFYWSSSEHSISYTWDMHMNFGHIDNYYKYSNFYVRAFMRW
jgi:hypothetical protein